MTRPSEVASYAHWCTEAVDAPLTGIMYSTSSVSSWRLRQSVLVAVPPEKIAKLGARVPAAAVGPARPILS